MLTQAPIQTAARPLGFAQAQLGKAGYNKLGPVLRAAFGEQVAKISLDGGYTCPNRDGTVASGGCSYCGEGSRGMIARSGSLERQFAAAVALRKEKKYIAYFQSYSGTYAPLTVLQRQWQSVLAQPGVVGLAISTRPDCLEAETLSALASLSKKIPLWLELGLESPYDTTLAKINRGHDVACFVAATERLAAHGIACVAHLIFGLPQDPTDAGLEAVKLVNRLPIWGVKIHPFHVVAGAPLATLWQRGKLPLIERETYIGLTARAVAMLRSDIVIHRLSGSGAGPKHLAPAWGVETKKLLTAIEAALATNNWRQGQLLSELDPLA